MYSLLFDMYNLRFSFNKDLLNVISHKNEI